MNSLVIYWMEHENMIYSIFIVYLSELIVDWYSY